MTTDDAPSSTAPASWHAAGELILSEQRRVGATITYKDLAAAAAIPSPHRIHKLTTLLEELTERDIALHQPVRAALAVSRATGIPGEGFFLKLRACGVMPRDDETDAAWHRRLLREM